METAHFYSSNGWRERIVGLDSKLPLLDGRLVPYINLDNAASTPPLWDVLEAVLRFMPYYSSVHRGSGIKSRISTAAYDDAHEHDRSD
jgi:selenocysteine lyase/cysteine desulfurase